MESIINYYYNLYPEEIHKMYGGFYFEVNYIKYLLVELNITSEELLKIYDLLLVNRITNYMIINNQENIPITKHENKEYVMFHVNCDDKTTLKFNEQIFIPIESNLSWGTIWSERINYYEIQINELAQDKKIVLDSVNYYIGLAENAISIANKYESSDTPPTIVQHYRMNVPVKYGNYFNPCNMVGDVFVRDIAEYVKASFFCEKKDDNFYLEYINSFEYSNQTANLLLARILYPSSYFDLFDEIIINDADENTLIEVINLSHDFEDLLVKIYLLLESKYQIEYINWLKKRAIAQR